MMNLISRLFINVPTRREIYMRRFQWSIDWSQHRVSRSLQNLSYLS